MLKLALTKGRIEKKASEVIKRCGYDVEELFKADMTLEMPGKITAYKNGKVDGKTITFDLSKMTDEDEMYAECKVPSMVPAFIGIGLAAAAAVAFIVLKKKRK